MKVLHIDTGWTWRGGQQQVFLLHRELLKNGVDSRLIARSDGELIVRCRKENLPVDPIVSPRPWNPLAIGNIWKAAGGVDIIHAHDSHSAGLAAIAKRLRRKIKFVCHRRVSYPIGANPFSQGKYKAVDGWIAVSGEIADSLEPLTAAPVKTIHSALDVDAFRKNAGQADASALRASLNIGENTPIVGLCGAFTPQKGHEVLVRAAEILGSGKNIAYVLAGDGPLREEIQRKIQSAGLEDFFHLPGFRPDVAELTSLFSVAVVPSVDGEGSSASIKEAMALGVPTIVSDLKGNLEVAGNACLSFPNRDANGLAERLSRLLDNKSEGKELSEKGRARAELFRPEITAKATIDFYYDLIKCSNVRLRSCSISIS